MDNLDDSENNVKVSDSAYSNSCSNSQSRRSRSSKSTHSGSNSSGSSGYGGKPSTSGSSNAPSQPGEKRTKDKDGKKKKTPSVEVPAEVVTETERVCDGIEEEPREEAMPEGTGLEVVPVLSTSSPEDVAPETQVENMVIATPESSVGKDELQIFPSPSTALSTTQRASHALLPNTPVIDGFWCVISMNDGIVMYTTASITAAIGFPKDIFIGRSFIDFVHPKDRNTFASQISRKLAAPKHDASAEDMQSLNESTATTFCRIRRYRGLSSGFGVKERKVLYTPFLLKLSFKIMTDEYGKATYLIVHATPVTSFFKVPNEPVSKAMPFVLRHSASGVIEYIGPESVPFLGYLPQELMDTNALQLYHNDDLPYIRQLYEFIVKEGKVSSSDKFRLLTQNGGYVKVETEWSTFFNPWSKKLEFVIGKHRVLEGPPNPDVFSINKKAGHQHSKKEDDTKAKALREDIAVIMDKMVTKPAEVAKQQMSKRCQDLASFMEDLMEEQVKTEDELKLEINEPDQQYYERDSVMLGGISPHHDYNDGDSSTATPLTYNQLNYNENLQRYFESYYPFPYAETREIFQSENAVSDMANSVTPVTPRTLDGGDVASSAGSLDNKSDQVTLTEELITKHNVQMGKELVRKHRKNRCSKGDRERAYKENILKKKEHLARCNASFHPTSLTLNLNDVESVFVQPHGVKRTSKFEPASDQTSKHHCGSKQHKQKSTAATSAAPTSTWPTQCTVNTSSYLPSTTAVQQLPLVSTVAVPGVFPVFYVPATTVSAETRVEESNVDTTAQMQLQTPVQYMMYPQPVFGSPFVYSPMNTQVSLPVPPPMIPSCPMNLAQQASITLPLSYYEHFAESGYPRSKAEKAAAKKAAQKMAAGTAVKSRKGSGISTASWSTDLLHRESDDGLSPPKRLREEATFQVPSTDVKRTVATSGSVSANTKTKSKTGDGVERTDDSSFSSFYSSFFKSESADDSDNKNKGKAQIKTATGGGGDADGKCNSGAASGWRSETPSVAAKAEEAKELTRRKSDPPWMEQVCVTSELVYKYQVLSRSIDEVLDQDKQKMLKLEQPSLVNEQLGQLYIDLQLEGVAARLTLEEGITSSGSSGDDASVVKVQPNRRRKREYSKLAMIYEEDAPFPPADDTEMTTS